MRFDPPRLTRGPLSGKVYVITHGFEEPHPSGQGTILTASKKYDVTDQFEALARVPVQSSRKDWRRMEALAGSSTKETTAGP